TSAPVARESHTAIWTGTEMIVWGGGLSSHSSVFDSGGRYDPNTDSWTATNRVSAPTAHYFDTAVWTGTEMIIWGGVDNSSNYLDTGARYNPSTDTWTFTKTPATVGRSNHTAVWTGTEMIIWGGIVNYSPAPYTNSGAKYNPATDSWVQTNASVYTPAARADHTAVWTGSEMIVWG